MQTSTAPPEPAAHPAPAADDTASLTHAIARGDTRAFGVLYERWFDRAYAAARRLTGRDEAFCLDVVQDGMLKLARCVPRFETDAALAAWLGRVLHRTALDRLRAERRRTQREQRREATRAAPDTHTELDHRIRRLRAQLRELPPEEQSLLAARFARDRTLAQAGQDHGMSGDAAHGRIRRTLRALQTQDEPGTERTTP